MRNAQNLYAIVNASTLDTIDFDDFVQTKDTVRYNRDRTQMVLQYNSKNNFLPNTPILSHEHVFAKVKNSPLWKNA